VYVVGLGIICVRPRPLTLISGGEHDNFLFLTKVCSTQAAYFGKW